MKNVKQWKSLRCCEVKQSPRESSIWTLTTSLGLVRGHNAFGPCGKVPLRFSSGKPSAFGLRFAFRKSFGSPPFGNVLPPTTFGLSTVYTKYFAVWLWDTVTQYIFQLQKVFLLLKWTTLCKSWCECQLPLFTVSSTTNYHNMWLPINQTKPTNQFKLPRTAYQLRGPLAAWSTFLALFSILGFLRWGQTAKMSLSKCKYLPF